MDSAEFPNVVLGNGDTLNFSVITDGEGNVKEVKDVRVTRCELWCNWVWEE